VNVQAWTFVMVGLSFALYIAVALVSRAKSTGEFYVAGARVPAVVNGMATAADWMSAASFLSMAGQIAFQGYDGSVYLMGWTGGYVLLALLLAPYLRKYGKFTVPEFVGDRYYSHTARVVAVVCALFVSFTYVAGQMRGVGIVFSRFLGIGIDQGVMVGMGIVLFYAVLGGMKGITYTQVAQYCVLIVAYLTPAVFISMLMTGLPIPQLGFGAEVADGSGQYLLDRLDGLTTELGFHAYTDGTKGTLDVLLITGALMVGTAGLPHVIVRFYTVPLVRQARTSAGWALLFIAMLYTTAPAVAAFARTNLLDTVSNRPAAEAPAWFRNWEATGLIRFEDHNGDGVIQHTGPASATPNELTIDNDIMVLANPEIARLPAWVVGLVAAGALAAALSTAAGLLLVISTAVSHDLLKLTFLPRITERQELIAARISAAVAVVLAGYFGVHPPGFVAQVVAFAFGLAAA
jgi:cation/acetate symporter